MAPGRGPARVLPGGTSPYHRRCHTSVTDYADSPDGDALTCYYAPALD
ncbi:hypothetical protein [Streptomyces sp. MMG1121]|nr:hypothetical protein [Streptomyces sp. MMG1121]